MRVWKEEKNSGGCSFGMEKEKEENARVYSREKKAGQSLIVREGSLRTISLFRLIAAVAVVVVVVVVVVRAGEESARALRSASFFFGGRRKKRKKRAFATFFETLNNLNSFSYLGKEDRK